MCVKNLFIFIWLGLWMSGKCKIVALISSLVMQKGKIYIGTWDLEMCVWGYICIMKINFK